MRNQDMPASPMFDVEAKPCMVRDKDSKEMIEVPATGETKREKAFWMVFSSMLGHPDTECSTYDVTAEFAIKAVNAGFKALESDNE